MENLKANELRIGNYVFADIGMLCLDTHCITAPDICDFNNGEIDIKPIPIIEAEDLLLALGFKKDKDSYTYEHLRQGFILAPAQDDDFVLLYREDVGMNYNHLKFIEYIHSLQNIIFELTEEELKRVS